MSLASAVGEGDGEETMYALRFSDAKGLHLAKDHPKPSSLHEAIIAVHYAGICSTVSTH